MPGDFFRTDDLPLTPLARAALRAARPLLEGGLGLKQFCQRYDETRRLTGPFACRALRVLDIRPTVTGDLSSVPTRGPLIVVANHPFGVLDGLAIAAVLDPIRPDVRVLANGMLARIPEMRDLCFFVDPFGGPAAASRSRAGLRAAHLWLRQDHALVVFPGGEVAHGPLVNGTRLDSPWSDTAARLALHTGATALPMHVHGTNSANFYAAGRVHPTLRTVLLLRELLKRAGQPVSISVGEPLVRPSTPAAGPPSESGHAAGVTRRLRAAVESLRDAPSVDPQAASIAQEIALLPAEARLTSAGGFDVYAASAAEIPLALKEIGRLREQTYRAVGEGTGRELDLDAFDGFYTHLFVWDRVASRLVGAYRIGDARRIVAERGAAGLYTRQLFEFSEGFIDELGPALELGRSWVRAEYQKNYNALLLLWKGIGRFVVERTDARVLFGPVSISARYSDASHALLMAFLEQNHRHAPLAALVRGRHPKTAAPMPSHVVLPTSIDEAHKLVAEMEEDGKGLPVLLRQYLKLNARLIGFNVDPDFGDALDALMMVDLTQVDRAILARYFGRDGLQHFLMRQLNRSGTRAA